MNIKVEKKKGEVTREENVRALDKEIQRHNLQILGFCKKKKKVNIVK